MVRGHTFLTFDVSSTIAVLQVCHRQYVLPPRPIADHLMSLCVLTAISTVGYGEMTPRSFFGRLITLPLLLFGLLLIALPSFVLGREFSMIWNDMTSGHLPRTPYMQSQLVRSSRPHVRHQPHETSSSRRARGSSRACVAPAWVRRAPTRCRGGIVNEHEF
jgi:hypothetical protein